MGCISNLCYVCGTSEHATKHFVWKQLSFRVSVILTGVPSLPRSQIKASNRRWTWISYQRKADCKSEPTEGARSLSKCKLDKGMTYICILANKKSFGVNFNGLLTFSTQDYFWYCMGGGFCVFVCVYVSMFIF